MKEIEEVIGKLINNNESLILKELINKLKLKGVNYKTIKKITVLSRELKKIIEEHEQAVKLLFQTYDIPLTEVGYSWKDHKDEEIIKTTYLGLLKEDFCLEGANTIEQKEFEKIIENSELSTDEIITIEDYLLKTE
jgi:arsenate reductase-like glutaredoxin family protein